MISYQLYSSRKFGAPADVISRVAEIGYTAVEGYGALFSDSSARATLKQALSAAGVTMPTAHVGLATLEDDPAMAEVLADIGVSTVYVPFVGPEDRPSDAAGWRAFADRIATAGSSLRDAGIGLGWHNHDFEFTPLPDGSVPMTHLLSGDLEWQFDVAWGVRAGIDPLAWIDRHGSAITAAHVKDIAAEGTATDEDGWADPGTGTMDWTGLAATLATSGRVGHWVMEHDNPSDDARFARRALDFGRVDASID